MMNKIKNLSLMTIIAVAAWSCKPGKSGDKAGTTTIPADTTLATDSRSQVRNDTAHLETDESAFVQNAAIGGMMEVEMGNLTTQKSKDPKVLAFAKRMITDHSKANAELTTIAGGMGIHLPGALPTVEQGHLAAMRQMEAKEYDQNYMQMMVGDHAKTIDLFNGATRFKDAKLSAFAKKTLPVLMAHNKMAIGIDSLIQRKKPDNNGDDLPNVDKKRKN